MKISQGLTVRKKKYNCVSGREILNDLLANHVTAKITKPRNNLTSKCSNLTYPDTKVSFSAVYVSICMDIQHACSDLTYTIYCTVYPPVHGYPRCMDIHHACLDLSYPKECISSCPWISQSIQSARLSVPSSELVPPPPPPPPGSSVSPASDCCSFSLWVQGGRHTRLWGGGGGWPHFRRRDRHSGYWYSMYVFCNPSTQSRIEIFEHNLENPQT
jgi:hypothetical protein